jgi:hypothetical protein
MKSQANGPDCRFCWICSANPYKSNIGIFISHDFFAFFFDPATEPPSGGEFMNTFKIKQLVNKKESRSVRERNETVGLQGSTNKFRFTSFPEG